MPTDSSVQTLAEQQASKTAAPNPPAPSTQPELTDEQLQAIPYERLKKLHPDVQTIETRYAAAHQEIDGKKTKKELEAEVARLKVMAGETSPPAQATSAPTATSSIDPQKLQQEIEWNILNKDQIKLAGNAYTDLLNKGYDRQDALELALTRIPSGDRSVAENLRAQNSAAGGSGSVDRSPAPGPTIDGVSREYIETMKAKFPNIPDARLAEIIQGSIQRKLTYGG